MMMSKVHRRRGNFLPGGGGGGGEPFAQKILASCPNFYETVVIWYTNIGVHIKHVKRNSCLCHFDGQIYQ